MSVATINDQELTTRVHLALSRLSYPQLADIRCEADGTSVTLSGTTDSYYLKQMAQTIAAKIPGVHRVINEIEVPLRPSDRGGRI